MNAKISKKLRKLAHWHPKDGKDTVVINTGKDQFISTNSNFKRYKSLKKQYLARGHN